MKKLLGVVILVVFVVVGILILCYYPTVLSAIFITIFEGIIGIIIGNVSTFIDTHGQGIKLWFQTQIRFRKKDIRLSFSYLYKIQVNGKYLLIKGNRLKNQYQPVGGVYKYYNEAKPFLESIHYQVDTRMKNMNDDDDLRIKIKGKFVLQFMEWFLSMSNREYDPLREFREELIDTKILSNENFSEIKYRKVAVHNQGITYSQYFQCHEFIYSDIFELVLNQRQKDELKKLVDNENVCWATNEDIQRLCINGIEKNLGNNSAWILEGGC